MKKIDKIILYTIFYIPVVLLFGYFLYCVIFGKTTEVLVREDHLKENFSGHVDSLYRDKQNHNVKIAMLSNGYKYEIFCMWEAEIQVGDSLIKKQGSFELVIFKPNHTQRILDYRNTYKKK